MLPASAPSPERQALGDVSNGPSIRSLSRTDGTSKFDDDGPNLNSVRHNLNDNLFDDVDDDGNAHADGDTETTIDAIPMILLAELKRRSGGIRKNNKRRPRKTTKLIPSWMPR